MLRWSIQRIKAMLLCIEYGILFVDTVDTKIKACNALNAMFVETVDTTVKTHPHMLLCIEYGILFVDTVDTKIKACNALNAIRKKFWKAETQAFSTIPSILYMSTLSIQDKDL